MSSTCSGVLLSNFLRSLASCLLVTGGLAAAEPVPVLELDWEAVPSLVSTLLTGGVVVSFLEDLLSLEEAILVAQGYRNSTVSKRKRIKGLRPVEIISVDKL